MNSFMNTLTIPDADNPYNYMLDTSAFNDLVDDEDFFTLVRNSLLKGFRYFITANQEYELCGMGAKVYDENCRPRYFIIKEVFRKKMPRFKEIEQELDIKRISSIASLMTNHTILDGTYRELNSTSAEGKMTLKILQFNEKLRKKRPFAQHYDAMIAEAAIHHACTLVTNDNDLKKLVNTDFPKCAISTKELAIEIANADEL